MALTNPTSAATTQATSMVDTFTCNAPAKPPAWAAPIPSRNATSEPQIPPDQRQYHGLTYKETERPCRA